MDQDLQSSATCLTCGYQLRDLVEHRFPECGRTFDPADPWTMRTEAHGRLLRALASPMGRPTDVLVVLVSLLLLWGGAWLAGGWYAINAGTVLGQAMVAYQVLRVLLQRIVAWRYRLKLVRQPNWLFVWPVLISAALALNGVALHFMVWLHRPWLDRYAHHVYTEIPLLDAPTGGKWIGLFHARRVRVGPAGVDLELGPWYGLWYDESMSNGTAGHISRPWYQSEWWPWWRMGNRARDG